MAATLARVGRRSALLAATALALVVVAALVAQGDDERAGTLGPGLDERWAAELRFAGPDAVGDDVAVGITSAGVVVLVEARHDDGFTVTTPCGNEGRVAVLAPVPPGTVVVDPGHGGSDPGAIGPNGLTEADLDLAVATEAANRLAEEGVAAVLTRTGDHAVSLEVRARVAVALAAPAFVSVHHNAGATDLSDSPGTEVYHQVGRPSSQRLGGLVYEEVTGALAGYPVRWRTFGSGVTWRTNDAGEDYFGVVRGAGEVPAVLAELAFLDHPEEADLLARPEVQDVEGDAVARGVLRFLGSDDPGRGFVDGRPLGSSPGGGPPSCVDPPLG